MSTAPNPRRRAALFALPLAVAGLLGTAAAVPAQAATTGQDGRASSLTCQGQGVDPAAKVRYRTETLVKAPLRTIWNLQTDVEGWPSWQAPVATMKRLDPGPLHRHSRFRWTTPIPANPAGPATTMVITSTVQQLQRGQCVRWTGPADADGIHIDGVHVWNFTRVRDGVLVRTEETHTGPQVDANVPAATEILKTGLESWLRDLKAAAENSPCASSDEG
ncbi:SRPBCC family protein [Amycolatopsis samaneae]|uniref:SRPBCC family protein n=1 Tax=Amycolatopsis samaneae TaxID=664691 RepID=A0ABW5GRX5_9PSEU